MKQISISDRQQTGRMEAIGAENKLWSSQGSKDTVSVSKPMYCFVGAFKMNKCLWSQGCGTRQDPYTGKGEGTQYQT